MGVAVAAAVFSDECVGVVAILGVGDGERSVGASIAEVERSAGFDAGGEDAFGGDVGAGGAFEGGEDGL